MQVNILSGLRSAVARDAKDLTSHAQRCQSRRTKATTTADKKASKQAALAARKQVSQCLWDIEWQDLAGVVKLEVCEEVDSAQLSQPALVQAESVSKYTANSGELQEYLQRFLDQVSFAASITAHSVVDESHISLSLHHGWVQSC